MYKESTLLVKTPITFVSFIEEFKGFFKLNESIKMISGLNEEVC
jgi:hypothetical protein